MELLHLFVICLANAYVAIGESTYPTSDDPGAFWFGTQDLSCLMAKTPFSRAKRSTSTHDLEAIERSTIQYAHRLMFYRGQVFEWGAGTRGYYFGPTASVADCDIAWEEESAGTSACDVTDLERYTRHYRRRYGGYNMVTNNCHHYVNRLAMMLSSDTCSIGEDKWLRFNRKFGGFMQKFMAMFRPDSEAHPATGHHEGNPHNINDWPIVRWYRK